MIKIGIVGYGNLSRAAIDNLKNFPDMQLEAIFTRRKADVKTHFPVYDVNEINSFIGKIDVLLLCGGSATDLPETTPKLAKQFNVVDSYDTHAKIPQHLSAVNAAAVGGKKVAVISVGWDPGLFSIARAYFSAFLPSGSDYTFWGKGVSQGHSDAIRRISGVKQAVQYTIPKQAAIDAVRSGLGSTLTTKDKHLRECFVVVDENADKALIEKTIKNMPNYFAEYDSVVNFITEAEFNKNHRKMPHGGMVINSGRSMAEINNTLELSIKLDSNPHFTSGIMLAYARAAYRLSQEGAIGCFTPYDIAISKLMLGGREEAIKSLL